MSGKKTIGIGMDYSPTSVLAARWVADNIVSAGDQVVLIQVNLSKDPHAHYDLWKTGSPYIPLGELKDPHVHQQYGISPDAEILEVLDAVAGAKLVQVVGKVYWGDPREKLCEAVEHDKLDFLVVGSRGLGMMQRLLLGSVSNHVVNHASCPVTVVKGSQSHA